MKRLIYISLLLVLVSGCASSNITSNKSPNFKEKLSRVYLIIHSAKGAKEFSYSFKTKFLEELGYRGVTSDYHIADPLALESEKDIKDKVARFNPQVVIVMNQTEAKLYQGYNWGNSNNINGGTFDIKIFLPDSDAPVWRGSLEVYGPYGIEGSIDKSVKKLIVKFKEDNLI